MPYIKEQRRDEIEFPDNIKNAGELNYAITTILIEYLETKGERYQTYNDIMGALEGAKLEIYRRKVGNYEDKAILKNGDVF